jgi:phosphopantothenoylcysteine synthetase/decarboxylase
MTAPLGFVVCGAPLAARSAEVARSLVAEGWELAVGVTEAATEWIDPQQLTEASEQPASVRRRRPTEQRRSPRPDRVVAFPLTFNTANKIAHGIMDNHVTGTLCDALGVGAPIVAALMVSTRLWGHPAWSMTLTRLENAGVRFLDTRTGHVGPPTPVESGSGGQVVDSFDPAWVVNAVKSLPPPPQ